jgi:hypothetical protein
MATNTPKSYCCVGTTIIRDKKRVPNDPLPICDIHIPVTPPPNQPGQNSKKAAESVAEAVWTAGTRCWPTLEEAWVPHDTYETRFAKAREEVWRLSNELRFLQAGRTPTWFASSLGVHGCQEVTEEGLAHSIERAEQIVAKKAELAQKTKEMNAWRAKRERFYADLYERVLAGQGNKARLCAPNYIP